jgi:hypothetical protein
LIKYGIEGYAVGFQRKVIKGHMVSRIAVRRILTLFHAFLDRQSPRALGVHGVDARHSGAKGFDPMPLQAFHLFFLEEKMSFYKLLVDKSLFT